MCYTKMEYYHYNIVDSQSIAPSSDAFVLLITHDALCEKVNKKYQLWHCHIPCTVYTLGDIRGSYQNS